MRVPPIKKVNENSNTITATTMAYGESELALFDFQRFLTKLYKTIMPATIAVTHQTEEKLTTASMNNDRATTPEMMYFPARVRGSCTRARRDNIITRP